MLRPSSILAVAAAIFLGTTAVHVRAALNQGAVEHASRLELIVLEVKDCSICTLVRTHIQPLYERSPKSGQAPMRFVDLNAVDEASLGLTMPVTTVPTIVLRGDGKEIARLTGYTGPKIFFQAVEHMLARAE